MDMYCVVIWIWEPKICDRVLPSLLSLTRSPSLFDLVADKFFYQLPICVLTLFESQ